MNYIQWKKLSIYQVQISFDFNQVKIKRRLEKTSFTLILMASYLIDIIELLEVFIIFEHAVDRVQSLSQPPEHVHIYIRYIQFI